MLQASNPIWQESFPDLDGHMVAAGQITVKPRESPRPASTARTGRVDDDPGTRVS
jgi:hypothetical protein